MPQSINIYTGSKKWTAPAALPVDTQKKQSNTSSYNALSTRTNVGHYSETQVADTQNSQEYYQALSWYSCLRTMLKQLEDSNTTQG